jgi:hypothetical protein
MNGVRTEEGDDNEPDDDDEPIERQAEGEHGG